MALRKRKGWWWVDFQVRNRRIRRKSIHNSRTAAQALESELRQRLADGKLPQPGVHQYDEMPTLKVFAPTWFETYVKNANKPSGVEAKESILRVHETVHVC